MTVAQYSSGKRQKNYSSKGDRAKAKTDRELKMGSRRWKGNGISYVQ
jgi:hypothetical protein